MFIFWGSSIFIILYFYYFNVCIYSLFIKDVEGKGINEQEIWRINLHILLKLIHLSFLSNNNYLIFCLWKSVIRLNNSKIQYFFQSHIRYIKSFKNLIIFIKRCLFQKKKQESMGVSIKLYLKITCISFNISILVLLLILYLNSNSSYKINKIIRS